jgi:hypothetical protein
MLSCALRRRFCPEQTLLKSISLKSKPSPTFTIRCQYRARLMMRVVPGGVEVYIPRTLEHEEVILYLLVALTR